MTECAEDRGGVVDLVCGAACEGGVLRRKNKRQYFTRLWTSGVFMSFWYPGTSIVKVPGYLKSSFLVSQ